ncbi:MAG: hypothetical protein HRU76_11270 [Phycisphaeraceae bacterium]|nr:MAG: hypothetical protein HRU76_11270 [Phycisphaeraceae bacterium]
MNALLQRFRQYPPLVRWSIIGLAVVLFAMLWYDTVGAAARSLGDRAAAYGQAIERARQIDRRLATISESTIAAIGPIEPLALTEVSSRAARQAIMEVLNRFNVTGLDVTDKGASNFRGSQLRSLVDGNFQPRRIIIEVRFETTQENAFEAIAALESHPAIETVSKVRVSRIQDLRSNRKSVVVALTVEAWAKESGAGGAA